MAWRPHGHARVSSRYPNAAGVCDRCGRMFNRIDLRYQFDWAGTRLQNKRILVCDTGCYDIPQEQLRARILTPDPLPIYNPRPEPFAPLGFNTEQTNHLAVPGGALMLTAPDGFTVLVTPGNNPDYGIGP